MNTEDVPILRGQAGWLAIESAYANTIAGVDPDDQPTINELLKQWRRHYTRNTLRTSYYLAHYHYKGVAYSIPPAMKALAKPMIGWPNKAVRALADLSVFEGIDAPDSLQTQVDDIIAANTFGVKIQQAIVSAYTHGCSFMTISGDGDDIRITPRAADWSSALWDWGNDRIGAAMTIRDKDKDGYITRFDVWLPGKVYLCRRNSGTWQAERIETGFDQPTVVPIISDQQLYRPLGSSRITRPLMALTDLGLRTLVRMEATAEFYAAPRIWFLGANKGQVSPDTWGSIVSVINGIPAGRNGEKPELRQLTQASMQPHSDMLKTVALMVSSETDIPVNDLASPWTTPPAPKPWPKPNANSPAPPTGKTNASAKASKASSPWRSPPKARTKPTSANCGRSGTHQGSQRRRPRRLVPEGRIQQPRLRRQRRGPEPRRPDMGRDQRPPGLRETAAHAERHRRTSRQDRHRQDRHAGGRSQWTATACR